MSAISEARKELRKLRCELAGNLTYFTRRTGIVVTEIMIDRVDVSSIDDEEKKQIYQIQTKCDLDD